MTWGQLVAKNLTWDLSALLKRQRAAQDRAGKEADKDNSGDVQKKAILFTLEDTLKQMRLNKHLSTVRGFPLTHAPCEGVNFAL